MYIFLPRIYLFPLSVSFILNTFVSYCQVGDSTKKSIINHEDSAMVARLMKDGFSIKKEKAIAWFPNNLLSQEKANAIVDTLNRGIIAAEAFLHAPLAWQVHRPDNPITFYFGNDSFIAHASSADYVTIPFWRIKEGRAPWLHETVHEMLNAKAGNWYNNDSISEKEWTEKVPIWLHEGLADYITMQVSMLSELPRFDIFEYGSLQKIDSSCAQKLKNVNRNYVLSFIGKGGALSELHTKDRRFFAPVFYNCSCSFVKFVADSYGIESLLNSLSHFKNEREKIEELTGETMESLKKKWIKRLK